MDYAASSALEIIPKHQPRLVDFAPRQRGEQSIVAAEVVLTFTPTEPLVICPRVFLAMPKLDEGMNIAAHAVLCLIAYCICSKERADVDFNNRNVQLKMGSSTGQVSANEVGPGILNSTRNESVIGPPGTSRFLSQAVGVELV